MQSEKKQDLLSEDEPIPGQAFALFSFVSAQDMTKAEVKGMVKVRGVFSTIEEARAKAKELQHKESNFDIFVGEVGKWLPWDPKPTQAHDQVYYEDKLQEIMDGHKKNQENLDKVEKERQHNLKKNNVGYDKKLRESNVRDRLRQKLEARKANNEETTETTETKQENTETTETTETKQETNEEVNEVRTGLKQDKQDNQETDNSNQEENKKRLEEKINKIKELVKKNN